MLMWIELGVALLLVGMAFTCPRLGSSWLAPVERRFVALAHRRVLSVFTVAVVALAARAAVLPILPEPQPYVNDEFSHLLAADTFAHGRLTNSPHPLWIHFETFHEIQQPTYASMYPPGQGMVMAFGQVVTGHPFVGVWLSVALLCAALCWMLQGWFSPPWALLGGLLAVMHFGVFSYWANSYWGGAVAAMGGALVLGALPRINRSQRVGDALLMGLGAVVLANSRPYEGLIFCLPVAVALVAWLLRRPHPPLRLVAGQVLAPLGLVLSLGALFTCYYFWRVTGSPFRMPYQVDRATYAVAPFFILLPPRPEPAYHHQVMHDFYKYNELEFYTKNRSAIGVIALIGAKLIHIWMFFSWPLADPTLRPGDRNFAHGFLMEGHRPSNAFSFRGCLCFILRPGWRGGVLSPLRGSSNVHPSRLTARGHAASIPVAFKRPALRTVLDPGPAAGLRLPFGAPRGCGSPAPAAYPGLATHLVQLDEPPYRPRPHPGPVRGVPWRAVGHRAIRTAYPGAARDFAGVGSQPG